MNIPTNGPQEVSVQSVIVLRYLRGNGSTEAPFRSVTQVWSQQGHLIAEDDPTLNASVETK